LAVLAISAPAAAVATSSSSSSTSSTSTTTPSAPAKGSRGQLDPPDPYYPALGNRGYDVGHYDLGVAYDPGTKMLRGDTTIDAHATERLPRFNLDLIGFDVASVDVDGHAAKFVRTDEELTVRPAAPITKGKPFTVRVQYSGIPTAGDIPGIGAQNGWLTTNDGAATLGEPDGARRWYPANDHPSDKATFSFHVDAPNPLTAVANGTLVSKTPQGDRTIWNWDETAPMTTYLAEVAIGNLDLRDEAPVDGIAIRNAISPAVGDGAATAAAQTPDMLQFEQGWFGTYPFSTYGIMVPDGGPHGLAFEAQTFSLISSDLFRDPQISSAILAHELAHQWFGDSVSPATWSETWLNEGFATYAEWLWEDHAGIVPLHTEVERAMQQVGQQSATATDDPGLDGMFGTAPYERGGLTLHALRLAVGDAKFAEILQTYAKQYAGKSATTEDFIRVVNEVAGRKLTTFLRGWLGPGPLPELTKTPAPVGSDPPTAVTVVAR
jgi:aminopeptidase N